MVRMSPNGLHGRHFSHIRSSTGGKLHQRQAGAPLNGVYTASFSTSLPVASSPCSSLSIWAWITRYNLCSMLENYRVNAVACKQAVFLLVKGISYRLCKKQNNNRILWSLTQEWASFSRASPQHFYVWVRSWLKMKEKGIFLGQSVHSVCKNVNCSMKFLSDVHTVDWDAHMCPTASRN